MRLHAPGGFSLTSMHGIQSDIDVVLARQELLQGSEIKDVPQQVGIGFHRVHNFHWTQSHNWKNLAFNIMTIISRN